MNLFLLLYVASIIISYLIFRYVYKKDSEGRRMMRDLLFFVIVAILIPGINLIVSIVSLYEVTGSDRIGVRLGNFIFGKPK